MSTWRIFIFIGILAILVVPNVSPQSATQFKIGEPFPQIVLPSLKDGHPVSLSQFRGKKIILHIFASW